MNKLRILMDILWIILLVIVFSLIIIHYYNPIIDKEYQVYKFKNSNDWDLAKEASMLNIDNSSKGKTAKNIVLLNYHGVVIKGTKKSDMTYSLTIEEFKEHMFKLKEAGYKTVNLDQLYSFLKGETELPDKSIVVTFDDGIKETYYTTTPILKALDYNAVMFIIAGQSLNKESNYYMDRDEVIEMGKSPVWEIGSHSYLGHGRIKIDSSDNIGAFYSNKQWIESEDRLETDEEYYNRINNDLKQAKESLSAVLGSDVTAFALPFGEFGQGTTNYNNSEKLILDLTDNYYNMIFYQFRPSYGRNFRANYPEGDKELYQVMRIGADKLTADELLGHVEAAASVELPYSEDFSNVYKWTPIWGLSDIEDGYLKLKTDNQDLGTMAYLDGSYQLTDYKFSSTVINADKAERFLLLARFQSADNYVACKYSDGYVRIEKVIDAEKISIIEKKIDTGYYDNLMSLKIAINKNIIQCYADNELLVSAYDSSIPKSGGVGIRAERLNQIGDSVIISSINID